MITINSKQYKEEERLSWDNVAAGWKKWWTPIDECEKISRRLIDVGKIKFENKAILIVGKKRINRRSIILFFTYFSLI